MTAVVIGAGGTLGTACVERFLADGHDVVAADLRSPEILGATGIALDVTDHDAVDRAIAEVDLSYSVTAVVYAAGLNVTGPVDQTDWAAYERVMAVNLTGAFHVGAALQRRLRAHPRALGMVFLSSTAGLSGEAGGSVYCATKFGLRGFVESFAAEVAALGGRANSVCPGNVDSPMLSQLAAKIGVREGRSGESVLDDLAHSSAFGRLLQPAEIAATCVWLTGPDASGISGQTVVVDGPPA